MTSSSPLADRYRYVRSLGHGAMGDVWLAEDLTLIREVAIKRIRPDATDGNDSAAIARMRREAQTAARLHHPNVVAVFDLLTVDGQPYVVMEYVAGESLAQLVARQGVLTVDAAAGFVGQIADALAAAHERGIVHRDVKPANILISDSGVAKLADFGIARAKNDVQLTDAGQAIGTVAFMPPEVARTGVADVASDVWSLGATLFAAIEGRAPFYEAADKNTVQMLLRLINEQPPPARSAGRFAELIRRSLATDPSERPTASEVARELKRERPPTDAEPRGPRADLEQGTLRSPSSGTPDSEPVQALDTEPTRRRVQTEATRDMQAEGRGPSRKLLIGAALAVLVLGGGGAAIGLIAGNSSGTGRSTSPGTSTSTSSKPAAATTLSGSCGSNVHLLSVSGSLNKIKYGSAQLSGLSALAYDEKASIWVAAPDQIGDTRVPTRLWMFNINNSGTPTLSPPPLELKDRSGKPFDGTTADDEGLAMLSNFDYLVSSEIGPTIREYGRTGIEKYSFPIPKAFDVTAATDEAAGASQNQTLEGLTVTPDGHEVVAAMEDALKQDKQPTGDGGDHRLLVYRPDEHGTWRVAKQVGYRTSGDDHIVEVTAYTNDDVVVMEAPKNGLSVKLYAVRGIGAAKDVSAIPDLLAASSSDLVRKTLVADLAKCPLPHASAGDPRNPLLAQYQGMVLQPQGNGDYAATLVNDDKASSKNTTEILRLTLKLST